MLDNSPFLVASCYRSPGLLKEGEIVANGAALVQCNYNSTRCFREFGPRISFRIFGINAEMESAR